MPILFLGIFFTLAFSWTGLILMSQIQFGYIERAAIEENDPLYPLKISGIALQGKNVYRELGCIYCHSQQVRRKGFGSDYHRGWGDRQTVPRDYILQERVMLGTMRTGPDLMNVGQRISSYDWHYLHLFDPNLTSPGSLMPKFQYLFKTQKIKNNTTVNALKFPANYQNQPPAGYEIIPTDRASQLVEYLLSLRLDYEFPESKFYK